DSVTGSAKAAKEQISNIFPSPDMGTQEAPLDEWSSQEDNRDKPVQDRDKEVQQVEADQ
ncbi:unnamed protein product, partial [Urochloa humidicola]